MRYSPLCAEAGFFAGFFGCFLLLFPAQPFNDPGALWHVRVGEKIVTDGRVMFTDPFGWDTNAFWIPWQWLAEVGMYGLHRLGGFDAMLVAMAALLAAFAASVARRFLNAGLHPMPTAALVGIGMATTAFHIFLRPHLLTMILTGWTVARLIDLEAGRLSTRGLLWFIPTFVIWSNVHGGVLGGIGTVGLALAGWTLFRVFPRRTLLQIAGIFIGCIAATFVTPFGFALYRMWGQILGNDAVREMIDEHMPLVVTSDAGMAVLACAAFYLFMLAGTLPRRPRVSWLLPLAWLALAFQSIRHGPLFALAALVATADLLPHTRWFALVKKYGDTFVREPSQPTTPLLVRWSLPLLLTVASLGLVRGWARFDTRVIPVDLIEPVRAYATGRPPGTRIFNDANFGGFLIYFAPRLSVYMDDRCELHTADDLRNYARIMSEPTTNPPPLTGCERALVESDSPMEVYLTQQGWHVVARTARASFLAAP